MIYLKNLNDKDKFITKEHFSDNLLKNKACFPYEFLTKENIYNKELPSIEKFYSSLKLDNISEEDYNKTLEIYDELGCKNIKDYLDIYSKLDICLQTDIFNIFRNCIWNKFEIDCSKYITACSLSLDLMLKHTGVKIELIRDISIFDYVNSSISGGICIASSNIQMIKMELFHLAIFVVCIHMSCLKNYQLEIIGLLNILIEIDI